MTTRTQRLATLVRLREHELLQAGAAFSAATREQRDTDAQAAADGRRAARSRSTLAKQLAGGGVAAHVRASVAGAQNVGRVAIAALQDAGTAALATEQTRAQLLAARVRLRALEELTERLTQRERKRREHAEQRDLDEQGARTRRLS